MPTWSPGMPMLTMGPDLESRDRRPPGGSAAGASYYTAGMVVGARKGSGHRTYRHTGDIRHGY